MSSGRGNSAKEVQEAYIRRLTEATNSIISNYSAIVKSMKIEDDSRLTSTNQAFQDNYEVIVYWIQLFICLLSIIQIYVSVKIVCY